MLGRGVHGREVGGEVAQLGRLDLVVVAAPAQTHTLPQTDRHTHTQTDLRDKPSDLDEFPDLLGRGVHGREVGGEVAQLGRLDLVVVPTPTQTHTLPLTDRHTHTQTDLRYKPSDLDEFPDLLGRGVHGREVGGEVAQLGRLDLVVVAAPTQTHTLPQTDRHTHKQICAISQVTLMSSLTCLD